MVTTPAYSCNACEPADQYFSTTMNCNPHAGSDLEKKGREQKYQEPSIFTGSIWKIKTLFS